MKNFVQPGGTLTFAAPSDLKSGDPFMVGSLFAIAAFDAVTGAQVEGAVEGVFVLPKPNSVVAFDVGERVFFDAATQAAGATDSFVTVRLGGISHVAV